ncbi:MAG: hypothetical protein IANPNBLG_01554 [Bryobacteraceae bacterium]|nr:hypothetical protein [Bryobacteraceae bacterium]
MKRGPSRKIGKFHGSVRGAGVDVALQIGGAHTAIRSLQPRPPFDVANTNASIRTRNPLQDNFARHTQHVLYAHAPMAALRTHGADANGIGSRRDIDSDLLQQVAVRCLLGPIDLDHILIPSGDLDASIEAFQLQTAPGFQIVAIVEVLFLADAAIEPFDVAAGENKTSS